MGMGMGMGKDKDMRTPPPLVKEALLVEDISAGGSREELALNNPPRPLAATQGTLMSNVMSNMRIISMRTWYILPGSLIYIPR